MTATSKKLTHKRGGGFAYATPMRLFVDDAEVADFTGWQARCTINSASGRKIADATVTLGGGLMAIEGPPATWNWPIGNARFDVMFIDPGGFVMHTETVALSIQNSETTQ